MQFSVRFFISWITASVLMYVAFYMWHGIFLNDLNRLSFPKLFFLILAAFVYLVISFIVYSVYEMKFLDKHFTNLILLRGVLSGVIVGFILFSIITVLGISFTKSFSLPHLLMDFSWQIIEQIIGGLVIGFGKMFIFEPKPELIKK